MEEEEKRPRLGFVGMTNLPDYDSELDKWKHFLLMSIKENEIFIRGNRKLEIKIIEDEECLGIVTIKKINGRYCLYYSDKRDWLNGQTFNLHREPHVIEAEKLIIYSHDEIDEEQLLKGIEKNK